MPDHIADMNARAVDREQQSFAAVPGSARLARRFVSETLRLHGATDDLISDYCLVVSELATNVIEHGDGSTMVIFVDIADPAWWELEVAGGATNPGSQLLEPETWTVAGADEVSGRGLGIVRHLMDDIATELSDGRVSIRCRRRREAW
jgi:anti-sigma regulatory factor (Ser/Thr protein kinase)